MPRMSGNKGEWSELYTFLKLLAQGRLCPADERAERIEGIYFPIIRIIREETEGDVIDYTIQDDHVNVEKNSDTVLSVLRDDLNAVSDRLYNEILTHDGSFELQDIQAYANGICVTKIKSPSSETTDILMDTYDSRIGVSVRTGYSIKSEVGHAPTMINAGKTTNFIYKVSGITDEEAEEINEINTRSKIKDRMKSFNDYGGMLEYVRPANDTFKRNLIMVDGDMPKILADMLKIVYLEGVKDCSEVIHAVGERDPMGYGDPVMYCSKFKRLLSASALGMRPSRKWDGLDEANGGYIIVKMDGEIVAYTLYNRNAFEQYLLDNTIFENGSTNRHEYMKFYKTDDELYINLNFQVRFKKSLSDGD